MMGRTIVTLSVTTANGLLLHAHGQELLAQASLPQAESCLAYAILLLVNVALVLAPFFSRQAAKPNDDVDAIA